MDKKFKTLTVAFENCESLEIPEKAVKHLDLEGITQDIHSYQGHIEASYIAKRTLLQLDENELDKIYPSFSEYHDEYDDTGLDRLLNSNDIVSLIFTTEDDHKTEVYVDWVDDEITGGQYNIYQHYKMIPSRTGIDGGLEDMFGGLYIAIGKNAKFPDWVGEEDE